MAILNKIFKYMYIGIIFLTIMLQGCQSTNRFDYKNIKNEYGIYWVNEHHARIIVSVSSKNNKTTDIFQMDAEIKAQYELLKTYERFHPVGAGQRITKTDIERDKKFKHIVRSKIRLVYKNKKSNGEIEYTYDIKQLNFKKDFFPGKPVL